MKRILITTSSFAIDKNPSLDRLRGAGCEIMTNPHGRRLSEDEVANLLRTGFVGMIAGVEPLTRRVIEGAGPLRVISRAGIGLDNVDLGAADDRGIRVFNTPAAPVAAVAELTLGLMLDLLRRISLTDRNLRSGKWQQSMGNLLAFQTVGLVGFGRIGRRVAGLLDAFGATVLVCDVALGELPAGVAAASLDELLQRSDIVSLHLPYSKASHHMIGPRELELMKKSAFLVNTARGGLVDEAALEDALTSGEIAGAAIDTFEHEPYAGPLANLPQSLLTAHIGSYAKESRQQMEWEAAENLMTGLIQAGIVLA